MLRALCLVLFVVGPVLPLTGCSWLDHRARDAADVFLIAPEWGLYGVKAQVGPWGQPGVIGGLRGPYGSPGGFGLLGPHLGRYEVGETMIYPFFGFVQSRRGASDHRHKDFHVKGLWWIPILEPQTDPAAIFGGFEDAGDRRRLAPRYTQIEIVAGAFVGLRLGFNPGELVDFIAGLFGFDLYGDDDAKVDPKDAPGDLPSVGPTELGASAEA